MNVVLEYASIDRAPTQDGRYPIVIANGPVACEIDLFASLDGSAATSRRLFSTLLRQLAPLLAADDPDFAFVPRIDDDSGPWRIGVRMAEVQSVAASPPSAELMPEPSEPVLEGDPAYRIVLVGDVDTVTLRTDRAGVEALVARCRSAADAWRKTA
jgi:hypothetical protein